MEKHIENQKAWKIKYYKGLGTSTAKEAKEYFADMERHRILFRYAGPEDDAAITLAFSKKKIDDRKEWLTNFMEDRDSVGYMAYQSNFYMVLQQSI